MSPYQGYSGARKLTRHYGNELEILSAYMNRALNWPQIKPDVAKALHSYSLFLTGCNNAMQDFDQLQERENPTNLRIIVSKLPYKMREMWRVSAFDIQAANENSPENCKGSSCQVVNAFQKPCIFCEKQHTLAECLNIRNQPYEGRLEFL